MSRSLVAALMAGMLVVGALGGCAGRRAKPEKPGEPPLETPSEEPASPGEQAAGPPPPGEPELPVKAELPGAVLVVIDNHPLARPQVGVDRADLVYEVEAEWGITRFLAVFYRREAPRIGPVRSARAYFINMARAYDSPFAHAGGSPDSFTLLRQLGIKDMCEIQNAGPCFWRTRDRTAPYNLYTGTAELLRGARAKGFKLVPAPDLPRGEVAGGRECRSVSIQYSTHPGVSYRTTYVYTGARYEKRANGAPFVLEDGAELACGNVVVLAAETRQVWIDEKKGEWQLDIKIVGEGPALFFTAGRVYEGKWRKKAPQNHFEFIYQGQPMRFAPGRTWVNVVPDLGRVEYAE